MNKIPVYKFAVREDLKNKEVSFLPEKGTPDSTGWDVKCAVGEPGTSLVIKPGQYVRIHLGFRVFCPEGWWLELKPRSSSFTKKSLHALYGTIDEDFEGELQFACHYLPEASDNPPDLVLQFGEAIGQIIPVKRQTMKVVEVSNEEYTELCANRKGTRGAGGFGSTKK
jgi:dUTPase